MYWDLRHVTFGECLVHAQRLFALPKLAHRGTERTSQAHGQASSAAVGERPSLSSPLLVSPSQYHFGH